MAPTKIIYILLAICTLHNFLLKFKTPYENATTFDIYNSDGHVQLGDWRNGNVDLTRIQQSNTRRNVPTAAKIVREAYMKYFNEDGKVEFQDEMIRKGKA